MFSWTLEGLMYLWGGKARRNVLGILGPIAAGVVCTAGVGLCTSAEHNPK